MNLYFYCPHIDHFFSVIKSHCSDTCSLLCYYYKFVLFLLKTERIELRIKYEPWLLKSAAVKAKRFETKINNTFHCLFKNK